MQLNDSKQRRSRRLNPDGMLGRYIAATREAEVSGDWDIVLQVYDLLIGAGVDIPLPPGVEIAFSPEDAIRARGMGIRLV